MRYLTICLAAGLILTVTATAGATSIWDRAEYRPSSDLLLGATGAGYNGDSGYSITDAFQINLLYEAGMTSAEMAAVDAFNDLNMPALNFDDEEWYFLQIDLSGGLDATEYDAGVTVGGEVTATGFQWTLTGWNQTVFAGSIIDEGASQFLLVDPAQGYRAFPGDLMVNDVEVFDGIVPSEVIGYRIHMDRTTFESQTDFDEQVLEVQIVPEPLTMLGLFTGIAGLAGYIRRRKLA